MSNPGTKFFGQVSVTVDIWVDPEKSRASLESVADNVYISIQNACDAVAKELDAPDHGVEVCVK